MTLLYLIANDKLTSWRGLREHELPRTDLAPPVRYSVCLLDQLAPIAVRPIANRISGPYSGRGKVPDLSFAFQLSECLLKIAHEPSGLFQHIGEFGNPEPFWIT